MSLILSTNFISIRFKLLYSEILRMITATNIAPTYIGILIPVNSENVFPKYEPIAIQMVTIVNCKRKMVVVFMRLCKYSLDFTLPRSEERRVGKECRSRRSTSE